MKVLNRIELSETQVTELLVLGIIKNNWKSRMVHLYKDPTSDQTCIMVGVWFDGSTKLITRETIGMNEKIAIDYWQHGNKILVRD